MSASDLADTATHKLWAAFSSARLGRALRQHKRLQKAFEAENVEFDRLLEVGGGQPPQPLPISWARLHVRFEDELYFFIIAARQALSAVPVMRQLDPEFPEVRQAEKIRHWRDIEEHWDDPPRGKDLRALEKWREVSEDSEPNLTTGSRGKRLTHVSGVKLKKLRRDLKRARDAVAQIEEELFLHLYITPDEAAAILNITTTELIALPLLRFPEWDWEGGGVRFFREQVVTLRDTGSTMPESWAPHFGGSTQE